LIPPIFARPLDGADVAGLFHDADRRRIAPRIAADRAQFVFGEIEAPLAHAHPVGERGENLRQSPALLRRLLQEMIRQSQRRFLADGRQPRQLGYEIFNCRHAFSAPTAPSITG
jgi:hypothetical protein